MGPPIGIRAILSIQAVEKWRAIKIDLMSAFFQSGPAQRNVFVDHP